MYRRALVSAARPVSAAFRASALTTVTRLTPSFTRLPSTPTRSFASVRETSSALATAIRDELPSYSVTDDMVASIIKDFSLKVEVDDAQQLVVARWNKDGHEMTLAFDAQNGMSEPEELEDTENAEETEEDNEKFGEHTFVLNIKNKKGKNATLYCYAAADNGQPVIAIEHVTFADNFEIHYNSEKVDDKSLLVFDDLSDEVQDTFIDWLDSLNITDDLAAFVHKQSQLVRTINFTQKLEQLKNFTE